MIRQDLDFRAEQQNPMKTVRLGRSILMCVHGSYGNFVWYLLQTSTEVSSRRIASSTFDVLGNIDGHMQNSLASLWSKECDILLLRFLVPTFLMKKLIA